MHTITPAGGPMTSARLLVLACQPALSPHVEFAVSRAITGPVSLAWQPQPAAPGTLRAEAAWSGPAGVVELTVAALRQLDVVPFEVLVAAAPGCDGARWSWHPDLGLHHASVDSVGQLVVAEGPLRALLGQARDGAAVAQGLSRLLGDAWDEALDPLRAGADGGQVTRLRPTG
jgi:hypothetical protein